MPTRTDPLAAFPDNKHGPTPTERFASSSWTTAILGASAPTNLEDALELLAETRRLFTEHGVALREVAAPRTLSNALEQLAVDRETLAAALRGALAQADAVTGLNAALDAEIGGAP